VNNKGVELTHNREVVMDKGTMRLQENSPTKEFNATDIFGNPFILKMIFVKK
jgi:hypothetical protein